VSTAGSTQHRIPGDPTVLQAAFAEADGKPLYVVLAYGRAEPLVAKMDHIIASGPRVDVPTAGKVYVLDPQLKLHEARVAATDVRGPLWAGHSDEFFKSDAWQKDLYPLLKMHRWGGEAK
jgi:hypothetical protein